MWVPLYKGRYISDGVLEGLVSADYIREDDAFFAKWGESWGAVRELVTLFWIED